MLNIENFEIHHLLNNNTVLFYAGNEHHYGIVKDDKYNGFMLIVETLSDDGEYCKERKYISCDISTAIETVEAIERGERV